MTPSLVKILFILISLQVTVCKFTIDHYGIDLILDAAVNGADAETTGGTVHRDSAGEITTWDADVGAGEPWLEKKGPLYSNIYRKAA